MTTAARLTVRGRVQGVGFRPHAARLAAALGLTGWVQNGPDGVEVHVEGPAASVDAFARRLGAEAPLAAVVTEAVRHDAEAEGLEAFEIRESTGRAAATVAIAPDLATCDACLAELRDPASRHHGYPFLNCTQCGPRYSVVTALPYDRPNTTLAPWPMCAACAAEYADPLDRRYHAQPTACPRCGPGLALVVNGTETARDAEAVRLGAARLGDGEIVAIKGVGGYLLACDARNEEALDALRTRKGRRDKPFALMARDLDEAREVAHVNPEAESLLTSPAAPVVLMPAVAGALPEAVAPNLDEVGVILPYAPVHHLLFDAGAPRLVVMTSGNRSSEPIAFRDADALDRLGGLADAFLVGERPIARRVDDSVVRPTARGPLIVRRARGYAPSSVARIEAERPILALGGDLKCAPCLVVGGEAYLAPYVGDLAHYEVEAALREAVDGLLGAYGLSLSDVLVVHDAHPGYRSTQIARDLAEAGGTEAVAVQHHRAHVASVLAERGAWDTRVVGLALDGTGWGDDGTVWGGEVFVGSLREGFERVAHLRPAWLPGGDAAARWPVQAAAGFLADVPDLPDLSATPFSFPDRYRKALRLVETGVRSVRTTSAGRLFDAAAALCGFTGEQTYEGQAAMGLEAEARWGTAVDPYPMPSLDWRPTLSALAHDLAGGRPVPEAARAFHDGLAAALAETALRLGDGTEAVVASGGVFLNDRIGVALRERLGAVPLWLPRRVPVGDGGLAVGQAALVAAERR
ncbi:MAG: carbamoyltransferase HypF [Bacteroidota bacterium]